nr:type II secretion system protein [Sulfurimonas sp. SAG-AH-194-C21]
MKNSKQAFTMIELIFVIVILGILAAVAIPKLAATRDDAEISKIAHNIMMGAVEIASYAVANAKTEDDLTTMSNALKSLSISGEAVLTTKKAVIGIGSISDCITLEIFTSISDDNLTITLGSASSDNKCIALQSAIDAAKYPMKLRGQSVQY